MRKILSLIATGFLALNAYASGDSLIPLDTAPTNLEDKASLQRGAGMYVNYCSGCHSLQFVRYEQLAKDIGITDSKGEVLKDVVLKKLNLKSENLNDYMTSSISKEDSAKWFGKAPPDLSLVARTRGIDWLYTYLRSFYKDDKKMWGTNNAVYPDVGMPHVLLELQGEQEPIFSKIQIGTDADQISEVLTGVKLVKPGLLSVEDYDKAVADLVNFLDYVGEPHKLERKRIGGGVLLFLLVLILFSYLLKREYWKDVH